MPFKRCGFTTPQLDFYAEIDDHDVSRGDTGQILAHHKNHGTGGENGSIMVGMYVILCLASQKPSEREFCVPARTDLGVKLLK